MRLSQSKYCTAYLVHLGLGLLLRKDDCIRGVGRRDRRHARSLPRAARLQVEEGRLNVAVVRVAVVPGVA